MVLARRSARPDVQQGHVHTAAAAPILNRNLFVDRILPSGIARELSREELRHYRAVQPTPEDRIGVAQLPKQIVTVTPFLTKREVIGLAAF